MKNKGILLAVVAIVIVAALAVVFSNSGDTDSQSTTSTDDGSTSFSAEVESGDWIKGNPDAEIVLVEFGDFQCPACANWVTVTEEVVKEFGDHIAFVFRHHPLKSIHPNAQLSGQAAQAAGQQDKFWEMHDKLYETQVEWSEESNPTEKFVAYAEELGLDTAQFEEDLTSKAVKRAVDDSYNSSRSQGISSTPTFVLNGEVIKPGSLEEFRTLIREQL